MKGTFRLALAASVSLISVQAMAGGFINSSQSSVFNGMAYAGAAAPGSVGGDDVHEPRDYDRLPALHAGFELHLRHPGHEDPPRPRTTRVTMPCFRAGQMMLASITSCRLLHHLSVQRSSSASRHLAERPQQLDEADTVYQGSLFAQTSKLRITTTDAVDRLQIQWRMWSFGVGLQIQYAQRSTGCAFPRRAHHAVRGRRGYHRKLVAGASAGRSASPSSRGRARRSASAGAPLWISALKVSTVFGPFTSTSSKGTLHLPNRVNLSLRQTVTERLDILASVEWQNWGRLGNAALANPANAALAVLPFSYSGWLVLLSRRRVQGERCADLAREWLPEISPVTDDVRRFSLPDNDRLWLSTGFTYNWSDRFSVNASYSCLHIKEGADHPVAGCSHGHRHVQGRCAPALDRPYLALGRA